MTTAERIKARRKELDMSADVVADKLGVSRSTIFRYENGDIEKMPIDVIRPLAKVLRTTPGYLLGLEDAEGRTEAESTPSEISIDEEVDMLLSNISPASSSTLMLDGKPASPEAIAALRSALTTGVTMARQMEKEKKDE
ncbi:helix-turn-helix domain-containing protein [Ruminococcaceae bacterium OttesenSCG-928-I18]|nr:helix-turn-helix domain-containing protein [Ruminococcaceae bacterium OttesenSCG-928-I18]